MVNAIPWLQMDQKNTPVTHFVVFNSRIAPYNNLLIRQALSSAIDREVIASLYTRGRPATSLTPPEVLGRDMYNQVGMKYDLEKARALLTEAGYHNAVGLPELTFYVYGTSDNSTNVKVARALADMWYVIGVEVSVEMIGDLEAYSELIDEGKAGMILRSWVADYNDPDNFLKTLFYSSSPENIGFFADIQFDQLVTQAATAISPAERQAKYIQAEAILCEAQAGIIPLANSTFDSSAPIEQDITETPATALEYYDDFSDPNSGWDSYDSATANYGYHEGSTYYIETTEADQWVRSIPPLGLEGSTSDIVIGFSATTPESLSGEYGVWCKYTDYDNKYQVAISPEAVAYQISKTINGRTTVLTNPSWKVLNNYTLTKINEIVVVCAENEIGLYVNDFEEPVEIVSDGSLTQGDVALYIQSGSIKSNEIFKVLFHEFYAATP